MVAVIDYDAGNIRSVMNALRLLGQEAVTTRDAAVILSADHVILPGVGAFGEAMERIRTYGFEPVIREVTERGTPFLGICLGQQILFEESEETPGVRGLGIFKGICRRIPEGEERKIPQIGWNDLSYPRAGRLFNGVPEHSYVYFVHSYYVVPSDPLVVTAVTEYGAPLTASVEQGNVFACQFHPEKSAEVGQQILKNFLSVRNGSVCGKGTEEKRISGC